MIVSTKFKVGDKVQYDYGNGMTQTGVVCLPPGGPRTAWEENPVVWARWGKNNKPKYALESVVSLLGPRYKRNLPSWW